MKIKKILTIDLSIDAKFDNNVVKRSNYYYLTLATLVCQVSSEQTR